MKVSQEKLPASQISLEIEITAENGKKTYEEVVKDLTRSANIPGFRKGKVPRPILLRHFGIQRIKATALEKIVQSSLQEAIEQEEVKAVGNPILRPDFAELTEQYKPGETLVFAAVMDVFPSVELGDYQNLSIQAEEIAYDPTAVDEYLEQRRVQLATLVPVEDRPAQMGDVAIADYVGHFVNEAGEAGEEIPGTQATDFQMELAEGRFIEGMVEGIVGMNLAETKKVSLQFPEDYPREDLAGKEAVFTITLKELKEKDLPELDDDFAEDVSEFETMAELRESLESEFKLKAEEETKISIQKAIANKLIEESSIDLPETMIQQEVTQLLTQTATQLERMGMDIKQMFNAETVPRMREETRPEAIERLKESLSIQEVAQRESLEPSLEDVKARIEELMGQLSQQNVDVDQQRLREMVEEELTKEKTLDWLQEKAAVELVPQGSLEKSEEAETEAEAEAEAEEPAAQIQTDNPEE